ncbi:LacI family DNA-binding transcriptional regulator [Zavarzinia sp. CC-PAN008]|uniref:LacI family DNA-binding transcriptional regulator n=1 Tax=Zavarzinia sp. CC-PAN008 TaxID=3243332 RepID=UPI003F7457D1
MADGKRASGHRVGIRDVAQMAGVSTTAVSYALNRTGRLDPATRERIVAIAQKLGYRANANARNLRQKRAGVLALAASLPASLGQSLAQVEYVIRIWEACAAEAMAHGLSLLLVPFGASGELLASMPMDGCIVIDPVNDDPIVGHMEAHGVPVVTIGRDPSRPGTGWWVDSDHEGLTRAALDHMAAAGAKRPALITASEGYGYSRAASAAYAAWTAARGLAPLRRVIHLPATEAAGYEVASQMLVQPDRPDAIYAVLDRIAVGTVLAARAQGLAVPGDLLVIAGSDNASVRAGPVPITAQDLRPDELGRAATAMLLRRMAGEGDGRGIIIEGRLDVRASTTRT